VVDIGPSDHGQRVTATTLVKTYNLLGRVYLAVIPPFHRLVARNMLRQVAGSPRRDRLTGASVDAWRVACFAQVRQRH
jgi:Protein of unknown function (DUF2867)